jgi:hypothetical protein
MLDRQRPRGGQILRMAVVRLEIGGAVLACCLYMLLLE